MDMNVFALLFGVLGMIMGSFANVCIYRIPRGESIAFPGSHCPKCKHRIAVYDNIPLLSWLILAGKCRFCRGTIKWRYPLVEVIMGLAWGALAWHYGITVELVAALTLFTLLWILSVIDIETYLLPDVLTFPGIFLGLVFAVWLGDWKVSWIGAVAGYAMFWLVARVFFMLTGREGMGHGDFKLLAMLGAFMGWQALPFIIFASSFVGAVVGMMAVVISGRRLRTEIPFGPYLALAGMVWFVWGGFILDWYMRISGLK